MNHLHIFVKLFVKLLVPVLAAVQTWSSASGHQNTTNQEAFRTWHRTKAAWTSWTLQPKTLNPPWETWKSWELENDIRIIQIESAKWDTLLTFVWGCLRSVQVLPWHWPQGPQGFPRRWLTGQVWKRHFAEESVQGILHPRMRMRQANVVLRHKKGYKKDTKGIPSSRFVSPTWKTLKVTKVTTRNSDDVPAWVLHGPWSPWFYTMLNLGIFMSWNQWTSLRIVHLMQRSCPRTLRFQTFRCTRCAKFTALLTEFQWRAQNKSPSAPHLYISGLGYRRFNSFGSFTSQDAEDDGKTLAISVSLRVRIPSLRDIWEM
jgi:hypothetical protein